MTPDETRSERMGIGEFARLKGLTVKALRYYQEEGILAPESVDPATGYRYYSRAQFLAADIIKAARDMGAGIEEIKRALAPGADKAPLGEILGEWRDKARERMRGIERGLSMIDAAIAAVDYAEEDCGRKPKLVFIPARRILTAPLPPTLDVLALEKVYGLLGKLARDKGLVSAYRDGIVYGKDATGAFLPATAFMEIAGEGGSDDELEFLPAGEWLRLRFSPEDAGKIQRSFNLALSRLGSPPSHVVQVEIIPSIAGDHSSSLELQAFTGSDPA